MIVFLLIGAVCGLDVHSNERAMVDVNLDGGQREVDERSLRSAGFDDEPSWSTSSSMHPFNCTRTDNPLQVLRKQYQTTSRLSELSLDDGSYSNLAVLTDNGVVNAAAMFYSQSTGESWPFGIFYDDSDTLLCRWSDNDSSDGSSSITKDCFSSSNVGGQGWSYAGAIVNTTFYHELGFGPGYLKVVRNIHTDTPTFEDIGTYKLVQSAKYIRAADVTHLTKYGCNGGPCVKGAGDDSHLEASSDFLIAIANELEGLIIVSLGPDGTPLAYLYVLGLSIIVPDDNGDPTLVNSVSYFRATGACYTLWSDTSGPRVMCSSNGAKGLYELQLPLNLEGCENFWNDFEEEPENCWEKYLQTAKQCDRRCSYLRKPVVGYVAPSAESNSNDGLTCLHTSAAEDISDINVDTSTQEQLDDLIDCFATDTLSFEYEDDASFVKGAIVESFTLSTGINIQITGRRLNKKGKEESSSTNRVMIFDSSSPSGGDYDLVVASRNGDNILIISEDMDSSDPDDNYRGGVFYFDFNEAGPAGLTVISILVVDTEESGKIELFDYNGDQIDSFIAITSISNYESDVVDVNTAGVSSMKITLYGSGAIDDIQVCQTSSLEPTSTPTSSEPTLPIPTSLPSVVPTTSAVPTPGGCSFQGACMQVSDLEVISDSVPEIDCGGSCTYKLCIKVDTSFIDESSRLDQSRTCENDEGEGFSHACIPPEPNSDNWNLLDSDLCISNFNAMDNFFLQSDTVDGLSWSDTRYPSALDSTANGKDESGNFGKGSAGGTEVCVIGQGGADVYFVVKDGTDCDSTLYQGTVDYDDSSTTTTLDFTCGNTDAYDVAFDPGLSIIDSGSGQCNGAEGGAQEDECIWKFTLPACPTSEPTVIPTSTPTAKPTNFPTRIPSATPTFEPTRAPSPLPSLKPSSEPTFDPTSPPVPLPTSTPSENPTLIPSKIPTWAPQPVPTALPSSGPTETPSAEPTTKPSLVPTILPTAAPTSIPTLSPTTIPTTQPTEAPTSPPTTFPTSKPSGGPTATPTFLPTTSPTPNPTGRPTRVPTSLPTIVPTASPTGGPSAIPTYLPTNTPTAIPTAGPTAASTSVPTVSPSTIPTKFPTPAPTSVPTASPTAPPTGISTAMPTLIPTAAPTSTPTSEPTNMPTQTPTSPPTSNPTSVPTRAPTGGPTGTPTSVPSAVPTPDPTGGPTEIPTSIPTAVPSNTPTRVPTSAPASFPTSTPTSVPSETPTSLPSFIPTSDPTSTPISVPTGSPTVAPSTTPTNLPSSEPSKIPFAAPSPIPSSAPSASPFAVPTSAPSVLPTSTPTEVPTAGPTSVPTAWPTSTPSEVPTAGPTSVPTALPTNIPTVLPTGSPTSVPTARPTSTPTEFPTGGPTSVPSSAPSTTPTVTPTNEPTSNPTNLPTMEPTAVPSSTPISVPTSLPTSHPIAAPTITPTSLPTSTPAAEPTAIPISAPTALPSAGPTFIPTVEPISVPTVGPTVTPTSVPTAVPTTLPTIVPTPSPTAASTSTPISPPTSIPTNEPTLVPTVFPTRVPIPSPSAEPTSYPTELPISTPTAVPTSNPSIVPTSQPTQQPTANPTRPPSSQPTIIPASDPTPLPVPLPSALPSIAPTAKPSHFPVSFPTIAPTSLPSEVPTSKPSSAPTPLPTTCPTAHPSVVPASTPTNVPFSSPTRVPVPVPSAQPSASPTSLSSPIPSAEPTVKPSIAPTVLPSLQPSPKPSQAPTTLSPTSEPSTTPTARPTTVAPTTLRPTSAEPTTAYPTTLIPTSGLPDGCFSELSLTITNYDPTYYYVTYGAVWINGYIEHSNAGVTILRGINLTISLSPTSAGATLGIPSVWGREFIGKVSNDANAPTQWKLYGLDLDISRVDFQITVIMNDAVIDVGDSFVVDFIVDYEDHTEDANSLTEDLTIIVVDDGLGSCEYPEGDFANASLSILRPESPTTYRIYDWAVWVDCRISYSDAGNSILNDVNLKIELSTNATDGAILDTPTVWGRSFDAVTPNDAENPTQWCLHGLDLDISQVDFQVKVKMTDDLLTIGDVFIVTFTLEYEGKFLEEYLTINVRGDNDLPEGHFDNASLVITTTDPTSYYFYSNAVYIDGYVAHSDYGNSILSGLNLTISLSTPAPAGATLNVPSVWGKSFETVRANVVNETTVWYLEGLVLDIAQVSFQVIVFMDDDLLAVGDSFVVDFTLVYHDESRGEDLTINVEERSNDSGSNDDVDDDNEAKACSLAFGIDSQSSDTYYLNSGEIWVAAYFEDTGDCSWKNISLLTSVDTSCVSISTPCIWGHSCSSLTSNSANDPTRWVCSGLDMYWLISRIDILFRLSVSDDTCVQSSGSFTITFKYSQGGQSSSTDYTINVLERENDDNTDDSTWSWSCSASLVEGRSSDINFGIVNTNPEPYVLGTGMVWINAYISNLANTSKILSNVSLTVELSNASLGTLDYPAVWGQTFASYTANDVGYPTRWHLEGLDICVSRVDMQLRVVVDDSKLKIGDSFFVHFKLKYQDHVDISNFTVFVAADGGGGDYSATCSRGNFTNDMVVSLINPKQNPLRYTDAWTDNQVHLDLRMNNNGTRCLTDLRFIAEVSENRSRASIVQCNDYAGFASHSIQAGANSCFMTSPVGQGFFLRAGESVQVQAVVFVDFDAYDTAVGGNVSVVLKVYEEQSGLNASKDVDFFIAVRPAVYVGEGSFVNDISLDISNVRDNPYVYNVYSQSQYIHFDVRIRMENDEYAAIDDIKLNAECSSLTKFGTPYFSSYRDEAGFSETPIIQSTTSEIGGVTKILFQTLTIYTANWLHVHFYLNVHKDLFTDDDTVQVTFTAWESDFVSLQKSINFTITIVTTGAAVVTGDWTVSGMTLEDAQSNQDVFAEAIANAANVSSTNVVVTCSACYTCQRRQKRRRLDDITDVIVSYEIILPEESLTEDITSSMQVLSTSEIDTMIAQAAETLNLTTTFADLVTASVSNVTSYAITSAPTMSTASSGNNSSDNMFTVLFFVFLMFGTIIVGTLAYMYFKGLYCFEKIISKPEHFKPARRIEVKRRKSTWARLSSRFSTRYQKPKVHAADSAVSDLTGTAASEGLPKSEAGSK